MRNKIRVLFVHKAILEDGMYGIMRAMDLPFHLSRLDSDNRQFHPVNK